MGVISQIESFLNKLSGYVWGVPLIILLLGTGLYLTILLRGLQFRLLPYALYLAFWRRREGGAEGDISHFQALMTALAATVGVGNIVGVATAIALGGPGALFWMWITGLVGMATKYSEAVLAVNYRIKDKFGNMAGGPMYYIERGLGLKWLAILFALFASVAAFGIGNMVQANSVADALRNSFKIPTEISGIVLAVLTALVIIGGIKSIGRATSTIVPAMIVFYMLAGLWVIFKFYYKIPYALWLIIKGAFSGQSAFGAFVGVTLKETIRYGVARGIFSNESGLGSAPIAAAAAQTKHPVTQALVSMTQTFIDTLVVCSITGIAIVITGAWGMADSAGRALIGAPLTQKAFSLGMPGGVGEKIVAITLVLFAYSTILGWSYYGEKSIEYLLGENSILPYRIIFSILVFVGAVVQLKLVWSLADVLNGLMAFPNLVGLIGLSFVVKKLTDEYKKLI